MTPSKFRQIHKKVSTERDSDWLPKGAVGRGMSMIHVSITVLAAVVCAVGSPMARQFGNGNVPAESAPSRVPFHPFVAKALSPASAERPVVLTQTLEQQWSQGQWVDRERKSCTYKANGNVSQILMESLADTGWVLALRWGCTYDALGNRKDSLTQYFRDGHWLLADRRSFAYDAAGNRIEELVEEWQESTWVDIEKYQWTYGPDRDTLALLICRWETGECLPNARWTLLSEASDSSIRVYALFSRLVDGWVNTRRIIISEDEYGRRAWMLWQDSVAQVGKWRSYSKYEYEYDAVSNLTRETSFVLDDTGWVPFDTYSYTYDVNNRCTSKLYATYLSEWDNVRRWTYSYGELSDVAVRRPGSRGTVPKQGASGAMTSGQAFMAFDARGRKIPWRFVPESGFGVSPRPNISAFALAALPGNGNSAERRAVKRISVK